jgi:hypothetical protein
LGSNPSDERACFGTRSKTETAGALEAASRSKQLPNFLCSTVEFRIYLRELMSGLVLSSFFDFLRLFFGFAMPLSSLSIFFRP